MIKYEAKQKHLMLFYVTNDILKELMTQIYKLIEYCICHYFDDIIKFEEFDLDNILTNGKPCKNILVYDFLQNLIGAKPLRIRFDKIELLECIELDI